MANVTTILRFAEYPMRYAADALGSADENDIGNDDLAAAAIKYAADIVHSVVNKTDIPFPPKELTKRISGSSGIEPTTT